MPSTRDFEPIDRKASGASIFALVSKLFPICRSITGEGVRQTLRELQQHVALSIQEIPSGTEVFDWKVPWEWNIRDAYIRDLNGRRIVDFKQSNLHVVNYSVPVEARLPLDQLLPHLHTLPEQPELVPYRTSYYKEGWGFCLAHNILLAMKDPVYEVKIDSTLAPGSLTYGELVLPGESGREILISSHCCHPSLANDNLSGIAVAVHLAQILSRWPRRHTYRFLFLPGTIGAIAWLALHREHLKAIQGGLVLACAGDRGHIHYKRSRRGNSEIDRAAEQVLAENASGKCTIEEFTPFGYDERQYCSPGINLGVGSLARTPAGRYAEYHTSADNLDLMDADSLADTLATCVSICAVLEHNRTYKSRQPFCEPQLGKRNLYRSIGGTSDVKRHEQAILWILNLADGEHDLLDMARRSKLPFADLVSGAQTLSEHELLDTLAQARVAGFDG